MSKGTEHKTGAQGPDGTPAKDTRQRMTLTEARACFRGMLQVNPADIRTPSDLRSFYFFPSAFFTMATHLLNSDPGGSPDHLSTWEDTPGNRRILSMRYAGEAPFQVTYTSPQQEIEAFRADVTPTEIELAIQDAASQGPYMFTMSLEQKQDGDIKPGSILITSRKENGDPQVVLLTDTFMPREQQKLQSAAEGFQHVIRILSKRDEFLSTRAIT